MADPFPDIENRFLFSDTYFSEQALHIWQEEARRRVPADRRTECFERYINWRPSDREVAVFTHYAYADLLLPQRYDILFRLDDASEFVERPFTVTQSIWEAWLPQDRIDRGHKHLCVFSFSDPVPDILFTLDRAETRNAPANSRARMLGFCTAEDFPVIQERRYRIRELKERHGDDWWKFDEDRQEKQ